MQLHPKLPFQKRMAMDEFLDRLVGSLMLLKIYKNISKFKKKKIQSKKKLIEESIVLKNIKILRFSNHLS